MFELIWGIFNGILLLYFIVICFKSVKLVKEEIGFLASLVFVLGLLSFMSNSIEWDHSGDVKIIKVKDRKSVV